MLHAVRIRSENAAEPGPAIQATLDASGLPVAFLRDLGSATAKVVAACQQPPAVELVCHFHFLAAVVRKLMDDDHAALHRGLARCRVRRGLRDCCARSAAPCNCCNPCCGLPAIAVPLAHSQSAFRELRELLRLRHDALRQRERPAASPPARSAARLAAMADRVRDFRKGLRERVQAAPADT